MAAVFLLCKLNLGGYMLILVLLLANMVLLSMTLTEQAPGREWMVREDKCYRYGSIGPEIATTRFYPTVSCLRGKGCRSLNQQSPVILSEWVLGKFPFQSAESEFGAAADITATALAFTVVLIVLTTVVMVAGLKIRCAGTQRGVCGLSQTSSKAYSVTVALLSVVVACLCFFVGSLRFEGTASQDPEPLFYTDGAYSLYGTDYLRPCRFTEASSSLGFPTVACIVAGCLSVVIVGLALFPYTGGSAEAPGAGTPIKPEQLLPSGATVASSEEKLDLVEEFSGA